MSLTIRILALSLFAALTPSCSDDSAAWPLREAVGTDEQNALDLRLSRAAKAGTDVGAVEASLKSGADVNAMDDSGRRPLHLAARSGGVVVVTVLPQAGAEPRATDRRGQTAHVVAKNDACRDLLWDALMKKPLK